MKRILILLIMTLIFPSASASLYTGWLSVGEKISYGTNTIEVRDIGMQGEVLLAITTEGGTSYISLKIGEEEKIGDVKVKVERAFMSKTPMVYLNVTLPPVLINQSVRIGKYVITVRDVSADSVEIVVSDGTSEKVYKNSFKLQEYEVTISPRPEVFSGELRIGDNVTYKNYILKVVGLNMTIVNNKPKSVLILEFSGKKYLVEEDKSSLVGPFIVKYNGFRCEMQNNLCNPIISLDVKLRGVEISIAYDPSKVFWVYEGKGFSVNSLMIVLEGVADNMAYVSIRNNCGDELQSGTLRANPLIIGTIEYDGLKLGLLETSSDNNGKKAKFIAFYSEEEKPKYLAFLNVTIEAPRNATVFVPFKVRVWVKNEGTSKVIGMILTLTGDKYIKVVGEDSTYIASLDPGKSAEFEFTMIPLSQGNISVGKAIIEGPVPYPLACGGLTLLSFSSNSPVVQVVPANFSLSLSYENAVRVGVPFDVNISVLAPRNFYGNVTLLLPSSMGLLSSGEILQGKVVIPARNGSIKLVAVTPGNYTIPVILNSYGVELYKEEIKIEVLSEIGSSREITITKTETEIRDSTKTVTQTIERTVSEVTTKSFTTTITETTTTIVEKESWGLIPFFIGFIVGVGVIILIGWMKARSS
ncbi:MAG: hypothetical protein PWP39_1112 [Pyrococcus sp.]|uniref:hypothetical protein n=1 Tax=Pyrococcus sp. TaxID=33866 RepID=UPI00258BDEF8|nr:hypothetical protein [Pyrococcus sp.]MDK2869877.1 hypothetical protein [Pyrococcus sp.]